MADAVQPTRVTLIPGDGVGPEVVRSARRIIEAAGVPIEWEEAQAGAEVFRRGDSSGVPRETQESIARTRVVLKGPLETPVGFGEKSANVTLRKQFETYANVRPARELPGVPTRYRGEGVDFVVVRENVEDLYAGIEHMQSPTVAQALKVISRKGSEKVIRYAFELARREGRTMVTCASKANILKLTEGLFKRVFEEMAPDYPEIEAQHLIVDNVAHQMAKDPAQFDVLVMTNMNGDILSDLASGLVGGLGFACSGNYGDDVAIFEAVHGSAPKYAGKDVINPTALILSSVLMLRHIGHDDAADTIEDAVLATLESGQAVTQDLARQTGDVEHTTSTSGFTDAIIANLGQTASSGSVRARRRAAPLEAVEARSTARGRAGAAASVERRQDGVDVMIESDLPVEELGQSLEALAGDRLRLAFISSRGTKVYPSAGLEVDHVDWYRARFRAAEGGELEEQDLVALLGRIAERHRWTQLERLQSFDGEAGYTTAAGQ
ncbi:MAG TPA: NADP-dependent isocitrate dehydrogenase [Candidatus Limnocylindrales bacterium]|nr:NADP-dependent isocitrate dehydrogenase [Candidatus Limnocylindrales bacterium]